MSTNSTPSSDWVRQFGTGLADQPSALSIGRDGAIYVAGGTKSALGGQLNNGRSDAFLTKYDPDGNSLWTRLVGTASDDSASALSVGTDGAIYMAGTTQGSLDGQPFGGNEDAFLVKFNPDGTKAWTRLAGTRNDDTATALTTGRDGAIYMAGTTQGSLDGQPFGGNEDAFLVKFNFDGTKAWTRLWGTNSWDYAAALATGTDGAIYVAGYTLGNLDGQSNSGSEDTFLTKYSPDGSKVWTRLLGTATTDIARSVTVGTDGAVYVAGYTQGSLDGQLNRGGYDAFISKYSPDGTRMWTRLLGSGSSDYAHGLVTASDGAIYLAGSSRGSLDGHTNQGGSDAFLSRFNPDGTQTWTRLLGTAADDSAYALGAAGGRVVYMAGSTEGSLQQGQANSGDSDAFLQKWILIPGPDTTAPSIALESSTSSLLGGQSARLTFSLSEPAPDFVASDITVSGGFLSNFAGSGKSYSATFIPALNSTNNGVVQVASGKFSDASGNFNTDGAEANNKIGFTVNTVTPTISVTSDKSSLRSGEVASISFTLSASSIDFEPSDITVSGGSLSNFKGKDTKYTAIFTPAANSTARGVVQVISDRFSDANGNLNKDGTESDNTVTVSVDTTASPSIRLASDKTLLKSGEVANITFTLSEASTDFLATDVTVGGGFLSDFKGKDASYTATFTPNANSTDKGVVSVASDKFSDALGNLNKDGTESNNTVTMTVDTSAPEITITSDRTSLKSGESAAIVFALSEPASDFVSADVTVSGGTISNFAGSGVRYTALFRSSANSTGTGVIKVDSGKFSDATGNLNRDGPEANNTVTITVNTKSPTVSVSSDKLSLKPGENAYITFTLSETSYDFLSADVTLSGGTLSDFVGSGKIYTATFTPSANSTGTDVIKVDSDKFSDTAGNLNKDGSEADNSVAITVNTRSPTVSVASDKTSLKAGEGANITFSLSEASTDFLATDVTVGGGTLANFAGSGTLYTATFIPITNSRSSGVVSVASGRFSGASGIFNKDGAEADNKADIKIDTVRPTISVETTKNALKFDDKATITFTLSEASTDFDASDVTVSGGLLSGFEGKDATSYEATFTPNATSTDRGVVAVSSDKFSSAGGNFNRDGAESNNTVTMTIDTVTPTVEITTNRVQNTFRAGETATITFTLSEPSTDFLASDISISGGALSNFRGSGGVYTASFTLTAATGVVKVESGKFSDAAGNTNRDGAEANNAVTLAIDTAGPRVAIASSKTALKNGESAALTFNLSEPSSNFTATDISASGGSISNFTGSGTLYTALFTANSNVITTGIVSVASGKFSNAAGFFNEDGAEANNTITMPIAPVIPPMSLAFSPKSTTLLLGSGSDDKAFAVTPGSDGAIYLAGSTRGNLDGQTNNGDADAFLTKYNPDGSKAWTRILGTGSSDAAYALATGSDGAIYVAGATSGNNLDGQSNSGASDAFLTRYNPDGTKEWTRLQGTATLDAAHALTTGHDGAIYVAGVTEGNLDGQVKLGSRDAFLTRYNPDGTKSWTRLIGSSYFDEAVAATTGTDGAIYVAGSTGGGLDGQANQGLRDTFLTRFSPEGTQSWTRLQGTILTDMAGALATGPNGAVYLAGATEGDLDGQVNSGGFDAFLTQFNPDGTKSWTRLLGTVASDMAIAVTTGLGDAIYIAGETRGNLESQSNSGLSDAFLSRFNADGTIAWSRPLGTAGVEGARALASGSEGTIYVAGDTNGNLEGQLSNGGYDAFLSRWIDSARLGLRTGTGSSDSLAGGPGNDTLVGNGGSDTLAGGSGDDWLDGGDGMDWAHYADNSASYSISSVTTGFQIKAKSGSLDGTDTLTSVERVRFADVAIALDIAGNAGQAFRIYKAAFNRNPINGDKAGLGFWIDKIDSGMSIVEVSARFIDSAEFRSVYGPNPSNAQFLTRLYQNVLGREQPDREGYEWWLNQLSTNPEKTRAKVLADFAESAENQSTVINLIGSGIPYEGNF